MSKQKIDLGTSRNQDTYGGDNISQRHTVDAACMKACGERGSVIGSLGA